MIHIRRSRLTAALLGIIAMTVGLLLLPAGQGSLAASGAASPSPSQSPSASPSASPSRSTGQRVPNKPHGTTVAGPRMYDPAHNRKFAQHSTVTVAQTANLTNQMVHVSWTGFTPSSDVLYDQTSTDYPVMVAECRSAHPRFLKQCYGADNGGVQGAFGPFGPMNTAYATTTKKGTGQLDIQILTTAENQFLGCGLHHMCSLVIVPAQGGDTLSSPPHCSDHSIDTGGTDLGQFAFSSQTGSCSWRQRIIVPLRFAPAPATCAIKNASFTAIGSPMLLRAMNQWRAGLCAAPSPMAFTFNAAITEPSAIADLPSGLGDIALTTRPGPAHLNSNKTYTYAPIAISSVAVAYWIDKPGNGQPVRNLKLNPRLLAKLLTQSYNFENSGCGHGKPPPKIGCNGAVDNNPFSLFDDREFKRHNPKVLSPVGAGSAFQVPTVMSGHSDMTAEVTRWIANNPDGMGFMRGQFDPWGMHVNTNYLGLRYPVDSFTSQDSYPVFAHKYSPVFPLSLVASYQAQNWEPGTAWQKDQFGNFPRDPIEIPGSRALFAVLDYGDAAAFRFPVARILNHSGHYVAPSARSMAAAIPSLRDVGSNHITQRVNYAKQSAGAYPLTMVIYAMVPTSGEKPAKAAAIARFLDYVVGTGQRPGVRPGDLAPGYLPLTARMRAQTLRATTLVRNQKGNRLNPKPSASPSPSASSSAVASASPSPSPSPTPGQGVRIITQSAQTTGPIRYVLPALLIVGGLATLGGASSLMVGNAAAIEERVRRLRRLRLVRRR
jgi:hypothetical protein